MARWSPERTDRFSVSNEYMPSGIDDAARDHERRFEPFFAVREAEAEPVLRVELDVQGLQVDVLALHVELLAVREDVVEILDARALNPLKIVLIGVLRGRQVCPASNETSSTPVRRTKPSAG